MNYCYYHYYYCYYYYHGNEFNLHVKENLFSYDAMIITRTHFENEANGNLRMAFWTTSIAHKVFYVLIKKKRKKIFKLIFI